MIPFKRKEGWFPENLEKRNRYPRLGSDHNVGPLDFLTISSGNFLATSEFKMANCGLRPERQVQKGCFQR